tara:strand:- start:554 stop:988 length:435 start_codon:yes stop_codon:yes gene_type:complete
MSDQYKQRKHVVRKRDGQIIVGDSNTKVRIEGRLEADGNLDINFPFSNPSLSSPNEVRVLFTDGKAYEWRKEQLQSYITADSNAGFDFVYVNATRGFLADDKVLLNPFGATRETGVISYVLETQVYLEDAIDHPHYRGETLMKI